MGPEAESELADCCRAGVEEGREVAERTSAVASSLQSCQGDSMRRAGRACVALLAVVLLLTGSCGRKRRKEVFSVPAKAHVFYRRVPHPQRGRQYFFVVRDGSVLAQVAPWFWPGGIGPYEDREFYVREDVPEALLAQADKWKAGGGKIDWGPWEPEGDPDCGMGIIPKDPGGDVTWVSYWSADNRDLEQWFIDMEREVVREESRVPGPPDWVKGDPRILERLGLAPGFWRFSGAGLTRQGQTIN